MKTQGKVRFDNNANTFAPLEIGSGTTQAFGTYSGPLIIDNAASLALSGTLILNGNLRINSGGTLDLSSQQFRFQGLSYTNNGTLTKSGNFNDFIFNGVTATSGTIQHITGGTGAYSGSVQLHIANSTTVTLDAAAIISMPSTSAFTIDGGSTLDLPNLLTFNGAGPDFTTFVSNASPGLTGAAGIRTQGSVQIVSNANFSVPLEVGGGTTQSQGTFSAPLTIDSGATFKETGTVILSGNLTINGTLEMNSQQFRFQGSSYTNAGTLTNSGNFNDFL